MLTSDLKTAMQALDRPMERWEIVLSILALQLHESGPSVEARAALQAWGSDFNLDDAEWSKLFFFVADAIFGRYYALSHGQLLEDAGLVDDALAETSA